MLHDERLRTLSYTNLSKLRSLENGTMGKNRWMALFIPFIVLRPPCQTFLKRVATSFLPASVEVFPPAQVASAGFRHSSCHFRLRLFSRSRGLPAPSTDQERVPGAFNQFALGSAAAFRGGDNRWAPSALDQWLVPINDAYRGRCEWTPRGWLNLNPPA